MMWKYTLQRLLQGVLVLLGVVLIIFILFYLLPVDAARITLGQRSDIETEQAIRKDLGLDQPVFQRLSIYLGGISPIWIHDNTKADKEKYQYQKILCGKHRCLTVKAPYLGLSYQNRRPVSEILSERIPATLWLALSAMLVATLFGLVFGIIAALNHQSRTDHLIMTLSVLGISVPSYVSALLLSFLFGFVWHEYTGLSHVGSLYEWDAYGNPYMAWQNLILPATALGIRPIAIITQLTRHSMLEVWNSDYIRTAKAKGLPFWLILQKHALKNALNPVVTSVSGWFASLLAGAFFVEIVFNYKGLGYETVGALMNFDFPVAMGAILFTATLFVAIGASVDVLYGILDPRIRVRS